MRRLSWILTLSVFIGCVEPFQFDVSDEPQGIVVDGYISDLSYNDLLSYPQDSRYFELNLKYVSTVKNVRDEKILGARVELTADDGEVWDYAEIGEGAYGLFYEDFKVEPGRQYSLTITLPNGTVINSDMESLPESNDMGGLSISEKTKQVYENTGGETQIEEIRGIDVVIETLANDLSVNAYYKWDYLTTWLYNAEKADDGSPVKYCWNTTEFYFPDYTLLEDKNGNARTELFFLETFNADLNEGFSVLVRQSALSRDHFTFWSDIKSQENQGDLFAPPPYNTTSNLFVGDAEVSVYGFFGVISEKFTRWYYDPGLLSYKPVSPEACPEPSPDVPPPRFPASCFNCLEKGYEGFATNAKPWWWNK